MAHRRAGRRDFFAWGLLLLGLVLAAVVFSYDPTRPANAYPPARPDNLLGEAGGWLAEQLFDALGNAAYVLLAGWFALVMLLLARKRVVRWSARLVGWLLLVPTTAAAATHAALLPVSGFRCGPGGSLGAWLDLGLQRSFNGSSALLVLVVAVLLGAGLALDFLIVPVLRGAWAAAHSLGKFLLGVRLPHRAPSMLPKASPEVGEDASSSPETETDGEEQEEEAHQVIPIRHSVPVSAAAEEGDADPDGCTNEDSDRPAIIPITRLEPPPRPTEPETYELPSLDLLSDAEPFPYDQHDQHLRDQAVLLEKTFRDFELNVKVVGINTGPVITQYEVSLETGLRLNKVTRLADDIALNLKVASVRMVAPIPGKNTVGVEVPNEHRAIVRLKEVILTAGKQAARMKIPLFLGKDSEGRPLLYDLAEMPHLLIAGRTGTGKSVCLNTIILSMLMTRRPDEVKLLMIDPKRTELSEYARLPHLMHPVVTDMKKAEAILSWAVDEMEKRYDLLSQARVRSLSAYNQLTRAEILRRINPPAEERDAIPSQLPYVVIVVDEMADLVLTMKREVEGHIIRLAQKSRAAGIHLVVATQKPTVDVITGLIKSNLPARICFQVSSRSDSRVVLDEMGADKLLGKGDLLFLQPGSGTLLRAQGAFASDEEITRIVEVLEGEPAFAEELLQLGSNLQEGSGSLQDRLRARDELYEQSIEVVLREGRGSVSLLQRALGIGYGRAARMIDFMAEDGIVGDYRGSSAREVIISPEEWAQMKQAGPDVAANLNRA
jgi:S-DNA-T family DNA segregation ATPase FtsK/SpoIIIE